MLLGLLAAVRLCAGQLQCLVCVPLLHSSILLIAPSKSVNLRSRRYLLSSCRGTLYLWCYVGFACWTSPAGACNPTALFL